MGSSSNGSRSERAFQMLLQALALGRWMPGRPLPPTRDLERHFGVSHATVIRVLRRAVEEGLIEPLVSRRPAVVAAGASDLAREMIGRAGARGTARRLAMLVPESLWPPDRQTFYLSLRPLIDAEAERRGWTVEPVCWPILDQSRFIEGLGAAGYAAAMASGVVTDYIESLHALYRAHFPTVVWNCRVPQMPMPAIMFEEYDGARRIAEHLADLGHRNLCLAAWALDPRMIQPRHRLTGWLDALQELGLLESCTLPVLAIPRSADGRPRLADGLPALRLKPTAIVFAFASVATQFLDVPGHHAIAIPGQLSLATFGIPDSPPDGTWCPPLTTVWCDMRLLARAVIDMVHEAAEGRRPPDLSVPAIVRTTDSIGRPPPADAATHDGRGLTGGSR